MLHVLEALEPGQKISIIGSKAISGKYLDDDRVYCLNLR